MLLANKPTIRIEGEIGPGASQKFAQQVVREYHLTTEHIIYINSPGGVVLEMVDIVDMMYMMRNDGHTFTCIADKAYSAAFSIFQACDKRLVRRGAKLMQHRVVRMFINIRFYTWSTRQFDKMQLDLCNKITIPIERFRTDYIEKERIFGTDEAIRIGAIDGYVYDF